MEWTNVIIAIVGSSALTLIIKSIINRRSRAISDWEKISNQYFSNYDKWIEDYEKYAANLKDNINDLEEMVKEQGEKIKGQEERSNIQQGRIDALMAQDLRHRLIISILIMQIKELKHSPVINLDQVDLITDEQLRDIASGYITTQQLQDIAASMRNNESRRNQAEENKDTQKF